MKPFKTLTWGLLGLSIILAQPAFAQDRGADTRGEPEQSRDADTRGGDEGRGGDDSRGDNRDSDGFPRRDLSNDTPFEPLRVGTRNTTTAGGPISQDELELTCGAGGWLETWLEDENGNPIDGTYEYYCLPVE